MKKILKWLFTVLFLLVLSCAGLLVYAFKIEPYRLTVNQFSLNEDAGAADEIKIAQISDIHIKEDFTYQELQKVVDKLNSLTPDIVLFTGDLYDNYSVYHDDEHVIAELKRIEAGLVKLAVWGNRDYGGGASRQYETIMAEAGFILLTNESLPVILENGKTVLFTGLDDALLGNPSMPDTDSVGSANYRILITHEPDVIENYAGYPYDMAFAGHSHGGQVNIPLIKGITTSLGETYTRGMYQIDKETGLLLYVNTGIGTTRISVRFNVVPEIALFRLHI